MARLPPPSDVPNVTPGADPGVGGVRPAAFGSLEARATADAAGRRAQSATAINEAINAFGQQLGGLATAVLERQQGIEDAGAITAAERAIMLHGQSLANEIEANSTGTGAGSRETFRQRYDESLEDVVNQALASGGFDPSTEARLRIQQRGQLVGLQFERGMLEFEARAMERYSAAQVDEQIGLLTNAAFENPDQLDLYLEQAEQTLARFEAYIPADDLAGLSNRIATDIRVAAVEGLARSDPHRALSLLRGSQTLTAAQPLRSPGPAPDVPAAPPSGETRPGTHGVRVPAHLPRGQSIGFDNNNPVNLRPGGGQWVGLVGQMFHPDAGNFEVFATPEDGIRAGAITIGRWVLRGRNTPLSLINTLAPSNDPMDVHGVNNPNVYANFIARELGIGVNDPIDITNPETFRTLVDTIIRMENGSNPYDAATLDRALWRGASHLGLGYPEPPDAGEPAAGPSTTAEPARIADIVPGPEQWSVTSPEEIGPEAEQEFVNWLASLPAVQEQADREDVDIETLVRRMAQDDLYDYRGAWLAGVEPHQTIGGDWQWPALTGDGSRWLMSPADPQSWRTAFGAYTGRPPEDVGVHSEEEADAWLESHGAPAVQEGYPADSGGAPIDPSIASLPYEQRLRLERAAENELNTQRSNARSELDRLWRIEESHLLAGQDAPAEFRLSYEQVLAASETEEEARRIWRRVQNTRRLGRDLARVGNASADEMNAMLAAAEPRPGENFEAQQERYRILADAIDDRRADAREVVEPLLTSQLELMRNGITPVDPLDPEQLVLAYGDELGAELAAVYERHEELRGALSEMEAASPERLAEIQQTFADNVAGARTTLEQVAALEDQQTLQQATETVLERRRDDPAGEAIRNDPTTARLFEEAQSSGDPAVLAQAMRANMRWQADHGIPRSARVPLTEPAAAALMERFSSAETAREQFEILRPITIDLQDRYVARRVLAQLEEAGLSPLARYALDLAWDQPSRRNAAVNLLQTVLSEPADLDQQTTTAFNRERVGFYRDSEIGQIMAAVQQITGDNMAGRMQMDIEVLSRVAAHRLAAGAGSRDRLGFLTDLGTPASGGRGVGGAFEQAYDEIFGHLSVIREDGLAYVFFPDRIDPTVMENGLEARRRDYIDNLTADQIRAQTPLDTTPLVDAQIEDFREEMRETAVWVNAVDSRGRSGFILVSNFASLTGPDGNQLFVTMDEMVRLGQRHTGSLTRGSEAEAETNLEDLQRMRERGLFE